MSLLDDGIEQYVRLVQTVGAQSMFINEEQKRSYALRVPKGRRFKI